MRSVGAPCRTWFFTVHIRQDISPAFQLRRYAWSAKLPLSILTDFEEFAVYDCRIRPEKNDKARVFYSSCGMTVEHAVDLRDLLLRAALDLEAKLGEKDDYGQRFLIDLEVTGPTGRVPVRSAWIVRHDEDFPRFVSCYVL